VVEQKRENYTFLVIHYNCITTNNGVGTYSVKHCLIIGKKMGEHGIEAGWIFSYPTSTRRHGNFAGVHTLLRILLSSNSAVLINIITGVSPPHFDFVVYYVLCQC
jgi:hypothetical protein